METTVKEAFGVFFARLSLMNVDEVKGLEKICDIVDAAKWSLVQLLQSHLGFAVGTNMVVFFFAMSRASEVDDGLRTIGTQGSAGCVI